MYSIYPTTVSQICTSQHVGVSRVKRSQKCQKRREKQKLSKSGFTRHKKNMSTEGTATPTFQKTKALLSQSSPFSPKMLFFRQNNVRTTPLSSLCHHSAALCKHTHTLQLPPHHWGAMILSLMWRQINRFMWIPEQAEQMQTSNPTDPHLASDKKNKTKRRQTGVGAAQSAVTELLSSSDLSITSSVRLQETNVTSRPQIESIWAHLPGRNAWNLTFRSTKSLAAHSPPPPTVIIQLSLFISMRVVQQTGKWIYNKDHMPFGGCTRALGT